MRKKILRMHQGVKLMVRFCLISLLCTLVCFCLEGCSFASDDSVSLVSSDENVVDEASGEGIDTTSSGDSIEENGGWSEVSGEELTEGCNASSDGTVSGSYMQSQATHIKVYVCGAVINSGVYEFEEGARIGDAIDSAGGCKASADEVRLNLATKLNDGDRIYVPEKGEIVGDDLMGNGSGNLISNDNQVTEVSASNSESEQSSTVKSGSSAGDTAASVGSDLININTATIDELTTLSGIGETRANAIIDYRTQNGDFTSIEDIKNVSGIGDSTFNNIKDKITV